MGLTQQNNRLNKQEGGMGGEWRRRGGVVGGENYIFITSANDLSILST